MMDTNTEHAPPTSAPPLRRSTSDKVFAGVAGGIAHRLEIPAWVIRIAFVVLTVGGGFGLALYVAAWLLIPREDERDPIARRLVTNMEGRGSWLGIGLIGIGVLVAADSIGFIRGDLALAVFLAVIGVLLYRGELGSKESAGGNAGHAVEVAPPPQVDRPGDAEGAPPLPPLPPTPTEPPPPPPEPPTPVRPRSILGRLAFAAVLIAAGVMAFFDFAMTTFDPTPRHYIGLAIGVIGLALLVGGWFGRARGLIFVGIVLVPLLVAAPLAEFDYDATVGSRDLDPETIAQIDDSYDLSIGELIIDLRRVDFGEETVELDASVGIGSLRIFLPDDVGVDARARVGLGEVAVLGSVRSGGAREVDVQRSGTGLVRIDARANLGQVRIDQSTTTSTNAFGEFGDLVAAPESAADILPEYSITAGELTLDLSRVTFERHTPIAITNGVGQIRVIVPDADRTEVEATVRAGTIDLFGSVTSGVDVGATAAATSGLGPLLVLNIDLEGGDIIVEEN